MTDLMLIAPDIEPGYEWRREVQADLEDPPAVVTALPRRPEADAREALRAAVARHTGPTSAGIIMRLADAYAVAVAAAELGRVIA